MDRFIIIGVNAEHVLTKVEERFWWFNYLLVEYMEKEKLENFWTLGFASKSGCNFSQRWYPTINVHVIFFFSWTRRRASYHKVAACNLLEVSVVVVLWVWFLLSYVWYHPATLLVVPFCFVVLLLSYVNFVETAVLGGLDGASILVFLISLQNSCLEHIYVMFRGQAPALSRLLPACQDCCLPQQDRWVVILT